MNLKIVWTILKEIIPIILGLRQIIVSETIQHKSLTIKKKKKGGQKKKNSPKKNSDVK